MDKQAIADEIQRLDMVLKSTPEGQPVAMGRAFFAALTDRGMVSFDVGARSVPESPDANPKYLGLRPIIVEAHLPEWEFRIGPPRA